ncbi:MAG: selenocysteine-specific translation elongation factor [Vicinamibacteria bacterium]
MRSFIIGTAGHIDHGKSSLVKALTGTDPDRLKEEKERGITIDLGFAHAPLSNDVMASFIDVPGHEKFVRNMLAGASGIDAVLLVVAANEGVMPQTREHFHICRMLAIPSGLIVITKSDAADAATLRQVEDETRHLVKESFLEGAPMVSVSARTGLGLDSLRAALLSVARGTEARARSGVLRLPIDRVFTLRGFGTVVTGTLMSGTVAVGDEVMLQPAGKRARVRGLQVHGAAAEVAVCGERTALNLAGVAVEDLTRGDVVVRETSMALSRVAHVELHVLEGVTLKNNARVRIHAGSAEVLGRVRLAAAKSVASAMQVAEIRFEGPVVLGRGDRIVLRSYSPMETIAGGRVLDPLPRPRRRAEIEALQNTATESDADAALRFVREAFVSGLSLQTLAMRFAVPVDQVRQLLQNASTAFVFGGDEGLAIDVAGLVGLEGVVIERLTQLHEQDPLAKGFSKEEMRRRVFAKAGPGVFEHAMDRLVREGRIKDSADLIALPKRSVQLSGPEGVARLALENALATAGLAGLPLLNLHLQMKLDQKACENAVRVLVQEKAAERLGGGLLLSRAVLDRFKAQARERFKSGTRLDVAEVKDLTGLSRKYVIPLLEWLDRERVTRRVGPDRIVL